MERKDRKGKDVGKGKGNYRKRWGRKGTENGKGREDKESAVI